MRQHSQPGVVVVLDTDPHEPPTPHQRLPDSHRRGLVGDHHPGEPSGAAGRDVRPDGVVTRRAADRHGPAQVQVLQQRVQVVGAAAHGAPVRRRAGGAVSGQVGRHDAVAGPHERGHLVTPRGRRGPEPGEQHDRPAGAGAVVLGAVDAAAVVECVVAVTVRSYRRARPTVAAAPVVAVGRSRGSCSSAHLGACAAPFRELRAFASGPGKCTSRSTSAAVGA